MKVCNKCVRKWLCKGAESSAVLSTPAGVKCLRQKRGTFLTQVSYFSAKRFVRYQLVRVAVNGRRSCGRTLHRVARSAAYGNASGKCIDATRNATNAKRQQEL